MTTPQLLDFLHEHPATQSLAEALAQVLVLRGRPDLIPVPLPIEEHRRAS